MLSNDKLMLAYGLEKEHLDILKMSNINHKVVTAEMGNMKIADIIEGLKFDIYTGEIPNEKVILFNNYEDSELDKVIKLIRATMGKDVILAVVTETSAQWSFNYLLEHLIEEREWYKNSQKGRA